MAHQKSGAPTKEIYVRRPAVAGRFYPDNPAELEETVENYMKEAALEDIPGKIIALVEPHAAHVCSGPVAAYGYKHLIGKEYETIFVLAPSHRASYGGVSVIPSGFYRTPLGDVSIDEKMAKSLMNADEETFRYYKQAHEEEHSLEVQVPFLQVALAKGWKIVPIVYGQHDFQTCARVAQGIARFYDPEKHLIIASSDMSHYHPYDTANSMDKKALEYIEKLNLQGLSQKFIDGSCELCGSGPVMTMMIFTSALQGKAKTLKYANSGDTIGNKREVVGYGCIAFYTEERAQNKKARENFHSGDEVKFSVSEKQKKMLLSMARQSIEAKLNDGKTPEFYEEDPILEQDLGLFVTLRKEPDDMLRGCIGQCFPSGKKIRKSLPALALSSAFDDPRFHPVKKEELKDIKIEISLLSPMRRIADWREIQIPGHGVYVKRGFRAGVFLPQVADETGWDRETFMAHLCAEKAGLAPDAWKNPESELYVFTVEKFEEEI